MLWDVTPCRPVEIQRCFEGTYCLPLQGQKVSETRNQQDKVFDREDRQIVNLNRFIVRTILNTQIHYIVKIQRSLAHFPSINQVFVCLPTGQ
jgi:hypothetical protein